ncbi:ROK family protein [Streptomyces winkii]|uniref:ROK family protein n=1 Tax=Streptomyces winkii TaxID=3051178 RepID=UPI0037DA2DB5
MGAGLPALGAGTGAAAPDGATGGELWQQASQGEVWTGRHPEPGAGGGVPVVEHPPLDAEARRAVAEEGELWRDEGREPGGEGREPGPEPEPAAEPGPVQEEQEEQEEQGEAEPEPGSVREEAAAEAGAEARPAPAPAAEMEVEEEAGGPSGVGGRWGSVVGVGVAAPGPLDHVRGVLGNVTGFPGWAGFPLRDALARRLGMPVVVDKDTNAAALGLALRGKESLAYVHLGTGLGAGLVLDGRIHRGRRNGAGEFGHQVLQLDGPPCRCGRNGCLEALCLDAVRRGRADEAARVLGVGAANLVSLLDVDRVLLGGRTVLADPDTYADGVAAQLRTVAARHRSAPASGAPSGGPSGTGAAAAGRAGTRSGTGGVRVEVVPEGARTVADGAAQLVLAPLFGSAPGAPASAG